MSNWKDDKEGLAKQAGALLAVAMWMRDKIGVFQESKGKLNLKVLADLIGAKDEYNRAIKGLSYDYALARIAQVCDNACESFDKAGATPELEATRLEALEQQYAISLIVDSVLSVCLRIESIHHPAFSVEVQKVVDRYHSRKFKPMQARINEAHKIAFEADATISHKSFTAGYKAACIDFCTE